MPDKVRTADKNWIFIGDRMAQIAPNGGLCTIPLATGTIFSTSPSSPLYFDFGSALRGLIIDAKGTVTLKFLRSIHTDPPTNIDLILEAVLAKETDPLVAIPQPEMDNHKWWRLTDNLGIDFHEGGLHEVPQWIINEARASRWLRIDPLGGETATMKIYPTSAGL